MPSNLLVILARHHGAPIAAAICFRSSTTLYGRYWGSVADFHSLHFETCYYQGIDYCIREGLERFEPGTQGEHKIARGFMPQPTWSCHWLRDPEFHRAGRRVSRARDAPRRRLHGRDRRARAVSPSFARRRARRRMSRATGMRSLRWLSPNQRADAFPPRKRGADASRTACSPPAAISTPERLLAAYRQGIFPWYQDGQPILWWSPDPRAVLWPGDLKVSRSLRRSLDEARVRVSRRHRVRGRRRGLRGAAALRRRHLDHGGDGSRVRRLHRSAGRTRSRLGLTAALVGGLYGVGVGRVFFGESMFTRVTDASKVALVHAVDFLERARHRAHRLPGRLGAHAKPRRSGDSASEILGLDRGALRGIRAAADVALRVSAAVCRLRSAYATMRRPARGLPTVAKWQKKKQFKWKVR